MEPRVLRKLFGAQFLRTRVRALFAVAFCSIAAIEVLSIGQWLLFPYSSVPISRFESSLFSQLAISSPLLLVILIYSYELSMVIRKFFQWGQLRLALPGVFELLDRFMIFLRKGGDRFRLPLTSHKLLAISLISSVLVTLLPYRPDLNPRGLTVGIDSPSYEDWVNQMLQKSFTQAIQFAFMIPSQGSKPLVLIILYFFAYLGKLPPQLVVRFFPSLLAPLLVFSTYFFVLSGTQDRHRAALTAILAAFSFNITVGVWAGYLANWLALAEAYFLFAIVLSLSRGPSLARYTGLGGISGALLLTHPQTWALSATVVSAFCASRLRTYHRGDSLRLMIAVVGMGAAVDIAKSLLFSAYGATNAGIEISGVIASSFQSQLSLFWPSVVEGFTLFYNGLLANAVLIGLGIPFLIYLKFIHNYQRLLLLWVALPSFLFPFFNSFLQTRVIYDLPIPVLAMEGLLLILTRIGPRKNLSNIVLLAMILFSANYAIRSMTQL
ncbi:MAG: hypothetical protein AUJ07_11440 [Crenarchaeota archaeon 13_1_40CM_3_53_5]|nr:MAG: hypothetical protein AUJ07_11440 [Crenarchaeota archaeon 13_1_40CM_3_53_5]